MSDSLALWLLMRAYGLDRTHVVQTLPGQSPRIVRRHSSFAITHYAQKPASHET